MGIFWKSEGVDITMIMIIIKKKTIQSRDKMNKKALAIKRKILVLKKQMVALQEELLVLEESQEG